MILLPLPVTPAIHQGCTSFLRYLQSALESCAAILPQQGSVFIVAPAEELKEEQHRDTFPGSHRKSLDYAQIPEFLTHC